MWSGGFSGRYDWTFRRRWESRREGGVTFHGLVNPRSIGMNEGYPDLDVHCDDSRWLADRAAAIAPDVIHVHSLLGIPVETVELWSRTAPVLVSFHEFSLICQRRTLVQSDGSYSERFAEQVECASCVEPIDPRRYRLRARMRRTPGGAGVKLIRTAERVLRRDVEVAPRAAASGEPPADASEPYRRRLAESVAIVNEHVAAGIAVSGSVRETLVQAGVDPELVEVVHIGSASAERLSPMELPSAGGAPVSFLCLGGMVPNKGIHVLIEAVKRMDDPPRVVICGQGNNRYEEEMHRVAPPTVEFAGSYDPPRLRELLAAADVVVAPTVGPDTSPQVVLEALAAGRPVIGSRIGGIPDFVQDGVNGLLVRPGSADELAGAMTRLRATAALTELAAGVRPPKRVDEHLDDLEEIYGGLARPGAAVEDRVPAGA
jgi:glycosyltransferase involved in cell wall biosynthesis